MSDAYGYNFIFSPDARTGALTADQLDARRKIAMALATRNRPYPKTIGEGLTAFGEGLGEGMSNAAIARAEQIQQQGDAAALQWPPKAGPVVTPPGPQLAPGRAAPAPVVPRTTPAPVPAPRPATQTADAGDTMELMATATPEALARARASSTPEGARRSLVMSSATQDTTPLTPTQAGQQPQMSIEEWLQRIARNESGGSRDPYSLVGERSRSGDYPYGKYQVMGARISEWSKKFLGREITPQEFLANPQLQEQIARGQGSEYVAKYGPVGAAGAWFAGEKGMKSNPKDALGTSVVEYRRRFNNPLTSRDQIASAATNAQAEAPADAESGAPYQVASLGDGVEVPETATLSPRDEITQAIAGPPPQRVADAAPPVPQPQPPPQTFGPQLEQGGPRVPAFPYYKPEPKPPQPTDEMIHYRNVAADPYRSQRARETALQIYNEKKAQQDADFNREYEFWKANDLKRREYDVALPQKQADLTNAWLDSLKKPQGIIQGPYGPQAQGPQPPQQVAGAGSGDHDPRLGTPQSPQRTGTPTVPPVPPGIIPEDWAKDQAPKQSAAISAVQRAVPQFEDAIRSIDMARTHPGRKYGLGIGGIIARQTPETEAYAFGLVNDQMKGKTFLRAYETLKGGGQITQVEGDKATIAQARIDPRQDKKNYDASLDEMEYQLRRDMEIAQRAINAPVTAWRGAGDNSSYAPDIGQRRTRDGVREEYIGGNPADVNKSWRRVN